MGEVAREGGRVKGVGGKTASVCVEREGLGKLKKDQTRLVLTYLVCIVGAP